MMRSLLLGLAVAMLLAANGCSEHVEATKKCKGSEVDVKCEICCAENGASGFTYIQHCKCLK